MKSLYGLLRERCGLSIAEASAFHGVPINTVTAWSAGRRTVPPGVIAELRDLYEHIDNAAENMADEIDGLTEKASLAGAPIDEIEIGLSSDDHEAQSLGWPCVGAHGAAIGLAAMMTDMRIIVVPRGSTPSTAGAADAHDKKRPRPD